MSVPEYRDLNPHLQKIPAREKLHLNPLPNASGGPPKYQFSEGHWKRPVIGTNFLLDNVTERIRQQIRDDPDGHLIAALFCGGAAARDAFAEAHRWVRSHLGRRPRELDKSKEKGTDTMYVGPFIVLIKILDRSRMYDIRRRLLTIGALPVSEERSFAFHIVEAVDRIVHWTAGMYSCGIDATSPEIETEMKQLSMQI
ncbi:hypothetical protein R3P38DRAFT_3203762 [Favolaschia claudopus]|uniref:Uncharacterized protein n=1 Tax=Favolaschia claudopus TaxID=2862362 RepID=A0AAW0AU54_9AGAR